MIVRLDPPFCFLAERKDLALTVRAKLHQQPCAALGKMLQAGQWLPFEFLVLNHVALEAFNRDRIQLRDFGSMIACGCNIWIGNHEQDAVLWTLNELGLGAKNEHAGSLTADERPRD